MEPQQPPQLPELPLDFDASDPRIWTRRCFIFDKSLEPEDYFTEHGYSKEEILALLWVRKMRHIVTKNGLSLFITVDGRHRSGKSRFAVTLATLWDRGFELHAKDRMIRSAEQLLDLVEKFQLKNTKNPVIIVDEAGASMNNQEYFEKMNRAIIKCLTVIGYLHPTIIFIAPLKEFVLKGIQKMSHVYLRVQRSSNDFCTIRPYDQEFNPFKQKVLMHRQKVEMFGTPIQIDRIRFYMPPKHINDWYDTYEKEMKPLLVHEIREGSKDKMRFKDMDPRAIELITKIKANLSTFSEQKKSGKLRINARFVKTSFGVSSELSHYVKTVIENEVNKGIKMEALSDGPVIQKSKPGA